MSVHDSFPCSDCGRDFKSAADFSDHFRRDGFVIVGCLDPETDIQAIQPESLSNA